MIAMPQATAALYIRKFTKYLVNLIDTRNQALRAWFQNSRYGG